MRSSFLPTTGKVSAAQLTALSMGQSANAIKVDRLDIQRAQSAVLVEKDGVQYAIVSDDNYHFLDPYWKAMYEVPMLIQTSPYRPPTAVGGSASAKKVAVGGKLGIVKDPFGKLGTPQYLGATLPLDGYGIVNLSLSEDGRVLIGQLKGGFSANIFDMAQKPHQNLAWNVNTLLDAALALPEKDRQSKHIVLAASAAQLIPVPTTADGYVTAPAGTAFDPVEVPLNVTDGRMGDVIEVDLKRRAAFALLGISTVPPQAQSQNDPEDVKLLMQHMGSFWLELGEKERLTGPWEANGPSTYSYRDFTLATEADGSVLSRKADLSSAKFADEGRLYLVPNLSENDLARLRRGQTLGEKWATDILVNFQLDATARNILAKYDSYLASTLEIDGGHAHINLNVAAKDFAQTANTFFGDRPLDNPGYSAMTLKGEVKAGSTDRLDILKVEQRLKYLGFPAMGAEVSPNTNPTRWNNPIQNFKVNGLWEEDDQRAAYLFNKVVNYGPGNNQLVSPEARRAGSTMPESGYNRSAYFVALSSTVTGATTAVKIQTSGKLINYLNAYNAPHWMNIYDNLVAAAYVQTSNGMDTTQSMEMYGTSWMRDWLRAYTAASPALQTGRLRFNGFTDADHGKTPFAHGTHDLGMAMDLGFVDIGFLRLQESQASTEAATAALANVALTDAPGGGSKWSKQNALDLLTAKNAQGANLVRNQDFNNQVAALKNFLALYSITQKDRSFTTTANGIPTTTVKDTGDWDAIQLVNEAAGTNTVRTALFGDGTQSNGLIASVHVGSMQKVNQLDAAGNVVRVNGQPVKVLATVNGQNPLYDMRTVLDRLGVSVSPVQGHHNHFHIYLRPPAALVLRNLEAAPMSTGTAGNTLSPVSKSVAEMESPLLDLFINPSLPPQTTVAEYVSIAQADSKAKDRPPITNFNALYEACAPVETQILPGKTFVVPGSDLRLHWEKYPKQMIGNGDLNQAKVTVLEPPKFGTLALIASKPGDSYNDAGPGYAYDVKPGTPNGTEDRIVFLLEIGGKRLKVIERLILVFNSTPESTHCNGKDYYVRRISQISEEFAPAPLTYAALNPYLLLQQGSDIGVTYTFNDIPGSALGQTTGEGPTAQITLDPTAAGHGWYIDPTPLDTADDYLPTSNPNLWQAKAGSAAEGKMDMLSVLLHEYGHALGLEHSADARDFMATTLQPGERRLPSSEELALMSRLVAQLKAQSSATDASASNTPGAPTSPSAPTAPLPSIPFASLGLLALGRLRGDRSGTQTLFAPNAQPAGGVLVSAAPTAQYAVAANATLTNGQFNTANSWSTQGSVSMASGAATLAESATQQTRLNQVFTVGPQDRYLSFTLSGIALDSATAGAQAQQGPSDAFEVALLNANTGASVAGATGLTHTDANGKPKTKTVVQNDYPNINAVLQTLGITSGFARDHQNHFHIYLKPPAIQLLPSTPQQLNTAIDHMDDKLHVGRQAVDGVDQVKADKLLFEEEIMFALDVPAIAIPTIESVAIVAQVDASKTKPISFDYLLKDCWETQPTPDDPTSAVRGSSVSAMLRNYFQTYQNRKINYWDVKVSLLETTKNGELKLGSYIQDSLAYEGYGKTISTFRYDPQPGYLGKDRAVFAAEYGGKLYKVVLDIVVSQAIVETGPPTCPEPQLIRLKKPVKTSGSDNADPILTNDLTAWQRSAQLSALIASAQQTLVGFTDLPSTALGQTTGEGPTAQITLDPTAAGHGWYIDPTPLDNTDDYLPTSNPNLWQAKAGSAAEGKMDMLSVLLHEYGHALGLEHSADARDFMATTLQPGERRLPSSEELALMSRLVAQLKAQSSATDASASNTPGAPGSPSAPTAPLPSIPFASLGLLALGRLRSDRSGTQTLFGPSAQLAGGVLVSAAPTAQYAVAANATLTNGQFSTANSWSTQGSVSIAAGAATLAESATQQTRLNQVFTVGPQDRYLSFTLSGTALDSATAGAQAQQGPSDAFEVALLNANTGASVAGAMGLPHTDALLNLQAGGAELAASGVSYVSNQDGSRTCSGCKPSGHGTVVTVGPLYGTPTASAKWPVSDYHAKPSHSRRPIANGA